jgi:hypothetical protein
MSQSMDDEAFARQLQEEEDRLQHGRVQRLPQDTSALDNDAILARRLQQELNNESNHIPRQDFSGGRTRFQNMQAGQEIVIRLHHPHSGGHIGESLRAQYSTTSEVRFEVVKDPGKFLIVNEHGKVEFRQASRDDRKSCYRFELTLNDTVYLKCTDHLDKLNMAGEVGWFLALTNDGNFIGNSQRGAAAQWRLVASEESPFLVNRSSSNMRSLQNTITQPQSQPMSQPQTASASTSATGSLLGSLNPFGCKGKQGYEAAPLDADPDTIDEGAEPPQGMNPLLFPDTLNSPGLGTQLPPHPQNIEMERMNDGSTFAPPRPPVPVPSTVDTAGLTSRNESIIRDLPQFRSFTATLKPVLRDAVNADPLGFVSVIQSPELWSLLDAVPLQITATINETATTATTDTIATSETAHSEQKVPATTHTEEGDEEIDNAAIRVKQKRTMIGPATTAAITATKETTGFSAPRQGQGKTFFDDNLDL